MFARILCLLGLLVFRVSAASLVGVSEEFLSKREGDKVLCHFARLEGAYGPGDMWIRETEGSVGLYCRPEKGDACAIQSRLCFYCCLDGDIAWWPENWKGVLRRVQTFALVPTKEPFGRFIGSREIDYVDAVLRVVLSGSNADLDTTPNWFAWTRVRDDEKDITAAEGDVLLDGHLNARVYDKNSTWLRGAKGQRVLRYRSKEDVVFQYAPTAKIQLDFCLEWFRAESCLEDSWACVVRDFILHEERGEMYRRQDACSLCVNLA